MNGMQHYLMAFGKNGGALVTAGNAAGAGKYGVLKAIGGTVKISAITLDGVAPYDWAGGASLVGLTLSEGQTVEVEFSAFTSDAASTGVAACAKRG
jgi:hypothetical protein